MVTDVAVRADHGTGQHVRERPDPGSRTHVVALAQAVRMDENGPCHDSALRNSSATRSCCSGVMCGYKGRERISPAAFSATGKSPAP